MVAGESRNPGREQLMELANIFGLKNAKEIINQVIAAVKRWPDFAKKAGVTSISKRLVETTIKGVLDT